MTEIATLAGGCFWCTEAVFERLKGVKKVISGYTGGNKPNPTYEEVSSGSTGHAEAVQITYNSSIISYKTLLEIFFALHDPTTLNQQGADIGPQYRSAIFYHSPEQREIANKAKQKAQKNYSNPIVTEIIPASSFYSAEKYHQKYYTNNQKAAYCRVIIDPKIQKLYKNFSLLL